MPATSDLIGRTGDLKRQLLKFLGEPRFRSVFQQALRERFGEVVVGDEDEVGDFFDYFLLQHRLPDGRTLVDHFVAAHPELPEAERSMLLGWRDVVEAIFEVQRRDGEALIVVNLIDDLTYRVRSNMGPAALAPMRPGSFVIGRLVPVGDEWVLSGYARVLPASARADAYRAVAVLARRYPALVFRNPDKLELAWELQRQERDHFIAFFGADLVVFPGHELAERMRVYGHFRMYEVRDVEGMSAVERTQQISGAVPHELDIDLPDQLGEIETVGVVYDEVDGLAFLLDFGRVEAAFASPELASDPRHRQEVLTYLKHPSISPRLLRRLAERDPQRASRLFQRVLGRPRFSWERDGEALLRRYKASYFERPVPPGVIPLSETLARAHLAAAPARVDLSVGSRPGRNGPCPCGSGKKYKKCCGR